MPTRRQLANAIRALSMDAVQKANSGHPGMPMGMADIAQVLWSDFLEHNPANPQWPDRDRFVVSNGHGSMLLYSLLHLTGYPLDLEQLRNFRQFGSHTAGHPEVDPHLGIETTTGPLGQGLANAVGMALAEKHLAAEFNRPGHAIVDHHTWVFLGDGCLMEGVSHEACSLAGTWQLGKLICFYDDNGISIDGEVHGWFTDDTPQRFDAYGWQVIPGVDGHDPEAVRRAIEAARAETAKPTLICCKTIIGWGAPNKQGTEATHGAALGDAEVAATRANIGWPYPPFEVPDEIRAGWDARAAGATAEAAWNARFAAYAKSHPDLAAEFERRMRGELPVGWRGGDRRAGRGAAGEARGGRHARVLAAVAQRARAGPAGTVRRLRGPDRLEQHQPQGLDAGQCRRAWQQLRALRRARIRHERDHEWHRAAPRPDPLRRHLPRLLGLRAQRGAHGGVDAPARDPRLHARFDRPRRGRSDAPAGRARREPAPDSAPEPLAALRHVETAVAWAAAVERADGPTCLVLSRQALPPQSRDAAQLAAIARGGYVLREANGAPECVLIATGSEVGLAVEAATALGERGRRVRVVSMPSTDVFDAQPQAYRDAVLPPGVPCVAIEAGARDGWWRYLGGRGAVVGMQGFGASAPAKKLFEHFGFTIDNVVGTVEGLLG